VRLGAPPHPPDVLHRQYHGEACYRAPLLAASANRDRKKRHTFPAAGFLKPPNRLLNDPLDEALDTSRGRDAQPHSLAGCGRTRFRTHSRADSLYCRWNSDGQTDFALSGPS
jgi:hypothetical protein